MAKTRKPLHPDQPLRHPDHPRPVTRRDFLRQGFVAGAGMALGSGGLLSLFATPRTAYADLSQDILDMANAAGCAIGTGAGVNKIPFICFDLAGGANIAGSNVLAGGPGGPLDLLSTAGYSKLGLPGDMIPGLTDPTGAGNGDFTDLSLGLPFHSDSAFLRGILEKATPVIGRVNGAIIPARSDNDTGNNPHNPMYGIARAGADGQVVTLIGSVSSDSGGRSMAPAGMINPEIRPTKVDRPSDVTGMVDTGNLLETLSNKDDVVAVMESMARLSDKKLINNRVATGLANDADIKNLVRCGYTNAADIAFKFADVVLDPALDPDIVGDNGIFDQNEFNDREFQKTASVMKMVIDGAPLGYAGAGTIAMGGYDYHTGDRSTGEVRDLRAGRCMGACLQYAALRGKPLMIYVFSDGSLSSNGMIDSSQNGRGKGVWTGDNSSTAASFFLVYHPSADLRTGDGANIRQQIGWFSSDASVVTNSSPAANNVNALVETVILNYMALHGQVGGFDLLFPNHSLGNYNNLIAFNQIL